MEEIRYLNGWSHDRKRVPPAWISAGLPLGGGHGGAKVGYEALLPAGLPEEFTSKEFAKGRPSASPQPSGGFFFSTNWGWWTAWENRGDPTSTGLLNNQKRQGRK